MHLNTILGTSLMVQWLRLCASKCMGSRDWSLVGEPRSWMLHGMAKKKKKIRKFWERVPGLRWTPKGSIVSDSFRPLGLYSPWNSPGHNTGVGSLSLLPGIEPRSPTLQVDSLPADPQGKPKNTGVGSLSLLLWIFLTQELNWGLLLCRQILYHLKSVII